MRSKHFFNNIDKIMRVSKHEFWIIYFDRSPVFIRSSGNAELLLDYLLESPYASE